MSLPLHDIKHTLQWNGPGLTHCQTRPDTSLSLASHLMGSFPRQHCYPKPSLETDTHMLPNTQSHTFNHCLGSRLIRLFIIYVRGGKLKVQKLSIVFISTRADSEPLAMKCFNCCQSSQWFACECVWSWRWGCWNPLCKYTDKKNKQLKEEKDINKKGK